MDVTAWLLDSDPTLRWQAECDLVRAPETVWRATRARITTEGDGAVLLAHQDADGQWANGAYWTQLFFPMRWPFTALKAADYFTRAAVTLGCRSIPASMTRSSCSAPAVGPTAPGCRSGCPRAGVVPARRSRRCSVEVGHLPRAARPGRVTDAAPRRPRCPGWDDPVTELRALRVRTYGPDSDIASDPTAQRRLRELEAREANASPSPHLESPPDAVAAVPGGVDGIPEAAERLSTPRVPESTTSAAPGAAPAENTPWWRLSRRLVLAWIGSLAIAVIVAASVSWAVTRRVQADPQQIAVLGIHPGQRIPTVFGTDPRGKRFADFYGLTVIARPTEIDGRGPGRRG